MADVTREKIIYVRAVIEGAVARTATGSGRRFIRRFTTTGALETFTKLEVHARGIGGEAGQTVDSVKEHLTLRDVVDAPWRRTDDGFDP